METAELILIPLPETGHLLSSIEFGKRLMDLDRRICAITILSMKLPYAPHAYASMAALTASEPRIRLISLPEIHDPPPIKLLETSSEAYIYDFIQKNIPSLRKTLTDLVVSPQDSVRVAGLVLDFFCVSVFDIAREVNLPSYIFLTSNFGFLGFMQHLPKRHRVTPSEFADDSREDELLIPSFENRVPAKVLPAGVFDRRSYEALVELGEKFPGAKGILVNSFSELEPHAVEYFSRGRDYPPVYPIGPILNIKNRPNPGLTTAQHEEIMRWLDDQPESSVLFLCFGSMGVFGTPQIREIAHALELSGFRFIWAIRTHLTESSDPHEALPEGFMGRGIVCSWAPQVEILAHKATGGFVSHCGWNSIQESLWYGVPIATWPMYAEQQLNAFEMVRELGLAVEIRLDYVADGDRVSPDMVTADEIVRAVRSLMDGDNPVRKKVGEISKAARRAVSDGGSSSAATGDFIRDILGDGL
ncbi:PREDICTED: UDP-glycosyltransferase 71C5 [Tarenaya hassleriana]|uniref:UDP-glycosyltransferase 71C5 n=1 Tax=Tarenaya hassleriana TaxID=28532 RepID=UPI00053C1E71|nr:PREDICTED: UDP-glycosyltransferase 71C5 [Tarenaya hassleriana]